MSNKDRLMDVQEAAGYLGIKPKTIYNLSSKGDIPKLKAGGALRFRRSDLDRWLKEGAKNQRSAA
jgi:excisionase family DNA binding protein